MNSTQENDALERKIRKSLDRRFNIINETDLRLKNPTAKAMKRVFNWPRKEGKCLTGNYLIRLYKIEALTDIRLRTEEHFSQFKNLAGEAQTESEKVGKSLKKIEDNLWQNRAKLKFKIGVSGIEAEGEREKTVPCE